MGREADRGGKIVIHSQVSRFCRDNLGSRGERGFAGRQTNITNIQSKNTDAGKLACGKSKLWYKCSLTRQNLHYRKQGRRTNGCQNQIRNTASKPIFFIRSYKAYPLLFCSLNGCVNRYPLTVSGVIERGTKNKNSPTCWAHHTTDTWSDQMTGADNTVSNVKMHSSQRKWHPTKTIKPTDQTSHSCPSQTDGFSK